MTQLAPRWSQEQSIAFEAAADCLAHARAVWTEKLEGAGTAQERAELEADLALIATTRRHLTVHDDQAVAAVRASYGPKVRRHVEASQARQAGQQRAWMRLPSGAHLDLINPDPLAWSDADLAVRLSRTYRWGGESAWPIPLSVAQHSLLVLELRRQASAAPLTPMDELMELLHDAEEGFLGFDCIAPLKAVLGEAFKGVADNLMAAIARRYGLQPWGADAYTLHKRADLAAAASEAIHCIGWSRSEVREVLGIDAPFIDADPLAERYGGEAWAPWESNVAASRFLAELGRLAALLNT